MMAALFFVFLLSFYFIVTEKRKLALIIATINIFLCVAMLLHHATSTLGIRL
jgi:hypothetical protein